MTDATTAETSEATLWAALLEDTGDRVFVLDRGGRILAGNTLAADALGLAPAALPGATYAQNLPPHVQAERLGYLREAYDTARPVVVDGMLQGVMHRTIFRTVREIPRLPESVLAIERPIIWPTPTPPGALVHRAGNDDAGVLIKLTRREREVLRLIGQGLATADIAKILHRSVKTIEWHRVSLGNKLGITNRVQLARIAIRSGLTTLTDIPRSELEAAISKRKPGRRPTDATPEPDADR